MTTVIGTPPGVFASGYRFVPFDPATLPNKLGWWDADDASTFTYSAGTTVAQWGDKSGRLKGLTPPGAAAPTRSGTQNGRATVVFNGTPRLANQAFALTGPTLSIAWFAKPTAVPNADSRFVALTSGNAGYPDYADAATGIPIQGSATSLRGFRSYAGLSTGAITLGTPMCVLSIFNGSTHTLLVNGVAGSPVGSTGDFNVATIRLGYESDGGYGFTGDLFEIIVCSGAWDASVQSKLLGYGRTKWGTP